MKTLTLVPCLALVAANAWAQPRAFPWDGGVTLHASDGSTLSWSVKHDGDTVRVDGRHAKWTVTHVAKRDGTPVSTVKQTGDRTVRVDYVAGGARFVAKHGAAPRAISARNLWDGDSLDARLAGVDWGKVKRLKFSVIDTDSEDGTVYPMEAEYQGLEQCAAGPCHHVRVALGDWRAAFGPKWHFRYGASAEAPYLENESDQGTFVAKERR